MSWWRTIAERVSRRRVLERRLPKEFGGAPIFVSPDAALRFWRSDLRRADPRLFDAAEDLVRPGDVVWDVGANVGLFAFSAAALAGSNGKVLALEPDVWLVSLLCRSAGFQPATHAPVQVLPVAVADSVGIAEFCVAGRGRCSNHLAGKGGSQSGGARGVQHVMTVTLDWLLEGFPAPSVLKVDVEGAEKLVLHGGQRLLSSIRPRILIEVYEQNAGALGEMLEACGYAMFDADAPVRTRLGRPAYNTLALPV